MNMNRFVEKKNGELFLTKCRGKGKTISTLPYAQEFDLVEETYRWLDWLHTDLIGVKEEEREEDWVIELKETFNNAQAQFKVAQELEKDQTYLLMLADLNSAISHYKSVKNKTIEPDYDWFYQTEGIKLNKATCKRECAEAKRELPKARKQLAQITDKIGDYTNKLFSEQAPEIGFSWKGFFKAQLNDVYEN